MTITSQNLKAYMFYDRQIGPTEGAGLVFAYNRRQAKVIGWHTFHDMLVYEYIDIGVNLLKDKPWLFAEKKYDEPHAILDPRSCRHCGLWGQSPINETGLCESCEVEYATD